MNERLKWIPLFLVAVALGVMAWCLITYEDAYLWKVQELNLFLDTSLFFKQEMVVPGGMLTYLGTFFTEFFFHPWLGVVFLCGWWALLVAVTALAFKVPLKWLTLLLVPVALLLLSDVELGYWIYYLKLRGYFFVATIGMTIGVAAVWVFRVLPNMLRPVYVALSGLVLYPLLGAYGLLAVLLMGVLAWRLDKTNWIWRAVNSSVALLTLAFVPMFCYWWVYYQTNFDYAYMAALPLFEIEDVHMEYYLPFVLLGVFYVVLAACSGLLGRCSAAVRKPVIWGAVQVALLIGIGYGLDNYWYKDYNFHKELAMQRAMEDYDWDQVLREAADMQDEPTRSIVMMKNLALFRKGCLGDNIFRYRQGSKAINTPIPIRMTQVVGRAIYYHYGQLNYCHRWCLEDGVEYGWRAEYLKYMVRCALLDEEYEVAAKYIGMLKHTRYYKAWAEEHEQFLYHREKLQADARFAPLFHLIDTEDHLGSDNGMVEYFLMHELVNIESSDPQMQELSLFAALWMKDIQVFWSRFFPYAMSHQGDHMPRHYQEAAYLYGHLEHQVDISHMPFDQEVIDNYNAFMDLAQRCRGMSEEEMRPIFYPKFGHTFYYEYFLIRNQKLY